MPVAAATPAAPPATTATPAIAGSGAVVIHPSATPPTAPSPPPDTGKGVMAQASSGMQLFLYVLAGMAAVMLIFGICTLANTAGGDAIQTARRFALRDGSGNVSLLTEIIMFIVAIVIVGASIGTAFARADTSATTTSMLDPEVPVMRSELVAPFVTAMTSQDYSQPAQLAQPASVAT